MTGHAVSMLAEGSVYLGLQLFVDMGMAGKLKEQAGQG